MLKYLSYIIASFLLLIGILSFPTLIKAQSGYSRFFDGGTVASVETQCTCSGGTLIQFYSYVDNQNHEYVYQYGTTQLYAYYDIFTSGNYFLSTHFPVGVCLVYAGETCTSEGNPEGTLTQVGTSASQ